MNYPQFEVVPFTYSYSGGSATGYIIQSIAAAGAAAQSPPVYSAPGNPPVTLPFSQCITQFSLQASANAAAYPNAYVVGTGTGYWSTSAAAEAAAIADATALVNARNAAIAAASFGAGNPYVTLGAAVYGPG